MRRLLGFLPDAVGMAQILHAVSKYVPAAANADTARACIAVIGAQVHAWVLRWLASGAVPAGMPGIAPGGEEIGFSSSG